MKIVMTTARVLRELATELSIDAIASSATLFRSESESCVSIVSADDDVDSQRVLLPYLDSSSDPFVPRHLRSRRREVLSRMASFCDRVRASGGVSLPRAWHQYKYKNFFAFYALPAVDERASRWIAEVLPGDRSDVAFWQTTTSDRKETLQEFENTRPTLALGLDDIWRDAVNAAERHFKDIKRRPSPDTEISLNAVESSATKGWTYAAWLTEISKDQRDFIEAPTLRSVRLRGPAGSGKTLALTLKAVREVLAARESGQLIRVLLTTHSWALASEIDDSIKSMGVGDLPEIDVFPLLEIAKEISPHYLGGASGFSLIGEDSFSGKQAQMSEILDVLQDFINSDWVTYAAGVSPTLRRRFESENGEDRLALAWDLLIEFGSVIGASAIFPGAGAERRYAQIQREAWMLPFDSQADQRVVFRLYEDYMTSLDERALVTSD